MQLSAGTKLGPYQIVSPLGEGGMGEVYRALDTRLHREVAVKILSGHLADNPDALARFEREAMSVAKLSHPNILSIFDFGRDGRITFVATELVDGETLRARLQAGPLTPRRAVGYALQIARGVAAAHGRGIVHRDLKPENVMITREDAVKILDFGLAKSVDLVPSEVTRSPSLATSAGMVLGTFGYMAPEQVRGQAVDHRADIFAFGAILYEMLSGERAFTGRDHRRHDERDPLQGSGRPRHRPALDLTGRASVSSGAAWKSRRSSGSSRPTTSRSRSKICPPCPHHQGSRCPPAEPTQGRRLRLAWLPWAITAAAVIAASGSWWFRGSGAPPRESWSHFTRISETAGEETAPAISPDGSIVAYSTRVNGSWDIYAQRTGGRNATPIVNDPQRDEGGTSLLPGWRVDRVS